GAVVLVAAGLESFRARRARRLAADAAASPAGEPYVIYFTGESCTVCRTHQEPALAKLTGVRIDKVDALVQRELADEFHVYTLPTTVVIGSDGQAVHINYGYAPATRLSRQIDEARGAKVRTVATA
ncbi:MAG TPA: thioredoxin family protein, partial [Candidatus Dormibacteraeota bacterium]|nr:thioredoxin family protein [Candidatus Dormibacteraeota bacterium]